MGRRRANTKLNKFDMLIIREACKKTELRFGGLISVRRFWSFCRKANVVSSAADHSAACEGPVHICTE